MGFEQEFDQLLSQHEAALAAGNAIETRSKLIAYVRKLEHDFDTTRGLWCIDRKPDEVDHEWIKANAFELQ
jgi:hypothetical protein